MPKGYRLPDPVDPNDTACLKLYYPNAPEYIAAIWGSLGYLAQWSAWERDDSQSAKVAASLFKSTVAQSRAEFEAERDCTYIAEPEYPESETGEEELADFLWATKVIIEQIGDMLGGGETYLTFRTWALNEFGVYIAETFANLWDVMDGMTPAERTAAIAAIDWQTAYNDTYCYETSICGDGTYTQRYWCWGQAVIDGLEYAAGELSDDLLEAVAEGYEALKDQLGGNTVNPFSAKFHGYGSGFSFTEPVCLWTHTIDLTASDGGFVKYPAPWTGGVWTSGVGWQTELCVPDTYRNMHYIHLYFPASATIHEITHNYSLVKGDWMGSSYLAYAVRMLNSSSYVFSGWEKPYSWLVDRSYYDENITIGGIDADELELFCSCSRGYNYVSGSFDTHTVTIKGSGDNPWA